MPENYLSFLPLFLFISFILNYSKGLSSSLFPSQESEQLPCHKHQPRVLTLPCPLHTLLDALALLPCRLANLAHKQRKVNPDLKCNEQGLFWEQAHTLLVQELPSAVPWQSPGVGDAAQPGLCGVPTRRDDGSGMWGTHGGCCLRGKRESSRGPILVTSFLQRILENSNKIRNRLRYVAGLSPETCLP